MPFYAIIGVTLLFSIAPATQTLAQDTPELVRMLVDGVNKKRAMFSSGRLKVTFFEGTMSSSERAKRLVDDLRRIAEQEHVTDSQMDEVQASIRNDADKYSKKSTSLTYDNHNYFLSEELESSRVEPTLLEKAGLSGETIFFQSSYIDGLYSNLDPFRNRLHLNQTGLPPGFGNQLLYAIDPTLADFTPLLNLPQTITKRAIWTGDKLELTVSRTVKGYERQVYRLINGVPSLIKIESRSGESLKETLLVFLRKEQAVFEQAILTDYVVKITTESRGPSQFEMFRVDDWQVGGVVGSDFLISGNKGTRLVVDGIEIE